MVPASLRPLAGRAARLLGVYLACLAGAAVLSWPLLRNVRGHVMGTWPHPDIHTAVWFRWHFWRQLVAGERPMLAPDLYYPDGMDVTLHIWNVGVTVAQLPFVVVAGPLTGYNLSLPFLAAFNGLAGYVLGWTVGEGRRGPAIAGAVVLVASNFAWAEMIHGRAEQGLLAFGALYVAGLLRLSRGGGRGTAVATGLALAAAGLCYWFYAAFLALPWLGLALSRLARRRPDLGSLIPLGLVMGVAVLILAPAAWPVIARMGEADSGYARAIADTAEAAGLAGNLRRLYSITLLQTALWPAAPFPQRVCVGLPLLLLAILAGALVFRGARSRAGFLPWIALLGIAMAAGPEVQLRPGEPLLVGGRLVPMPSRLLDGMPLFERMWWPHRWLSLTAIGGAGCAAALVAALPRGGVRRFAPLVLAVLMLVEVRAMFFGAPYTALAGNPQPLAAPAFLEQLGTEPGQHPLIQLPLRRVDDAALIHVPLHRQPIDGGPAYNEELHAEPGYMRRVRSSSVLAALEQMARGMSAPDIHQPRRELYEQGFHYAVFWRDQDVHGLDWTALYSEFFGVPPVFSDDSAVVWDLGPP